MRKPICIIRQTAKSDALRTSDAANPRTFYSVGVRSLAETGGFEPPVEFNPDPSLAVKSIRPLWHVSTVHKTSASL